MVEGTCCDQAQIPDSPPDWAHVKAKGTQARAPVIQIVGANPLAIEQSLVESIVAPDMAVTHRPPFLGVQAQYMRKLLDATLALQIAWRESGDLRNGKRTDQVMLLGNPAQITAGAFSRDWIDAEEQALVGTYSSRHACSSTRLH
jgi:hypothetical protein